MKKFLSLYKAAVYSYLIDPLFYTASIITILFCSFRFFFAGKFFVADLGSTDLRTFFTAVPYISIIVIPLLVLRIRPLLLTDSIPFSPQKRFFSLNMAAFSAFAFPLLLLCLIPVCVSFFGDVDYGVVFTGFVGIFFYGFCALSAVLFFFSFFSSFSSSLLIPLIISPVFLAILN
uniref:hypothetical protein n=1 Tax=Treponema sp. TaxID=166 RepID=UPI00389042FA